MCRKYLLNFIYLSDSQNICASFMFCVTYPLQVTGTVVDTWFLSLQLSIIDG